MLNTLKVREDFVERLIKIILKDTIFIENFFLNRNDIDKGLYLYEMKEE